MLRTLASFWHWLTTSRYTRFMEAENARLNERIAALESVLIPRLAAATQAQSQAKVAEVEKPQIAQKPVSQKVQTCAQCGDEYQGVKCPRCGATQPVIAHRSGWKGFSRMRTQAENLSEADAKKLLERTN